MATFLRTLATTLVKHLQLPVVQIKRCESSCLPICKECSVCAKHVYMDPKCKIGLIVGGATPIGFATARELLCNDFYRVILGGKDTCKGAECVKNLNDQFGKNKSCFMLLDTEKHQDFADVMKSIIRVLGNLDLVVNTPPLKTRNWEDEIDSNILAVIRSTSVASCLMTDQKLRPGGIIVNIASALAMDDFPKAPVHVSAANGIIGLSQAWGATPNFFNSKVRVVAMCPGLTDGLPVDNSLQPNDPYYLKEMSKLPKQSAGCVGRAVVYAVQHAPSGSVWIVDNNILYRNRIPKRKNYSQTIRYV